MPAVIVWNNFFLLNFYKKSIFLYTILMKYDRIFYVSWSKLIWFMFCVLQFVIGMDCGLSTKFVMGKSGKMFWEALEVTEIL